MTPPPRHDGAESLHPQHLSLYQINRRGESLVSRGKSTYIVLLFQLKCELVIPGADLESRVRCNTLDSCFRRNDTEVMYGLSLQEY